MNIIQTPADPHKWGLSSSIPAVPGRLWYRVDTFVIHWMDTTLSGADDVFCKPGGRMVTAHFGVEEDMVHQYVSVKNTAWHAGRWATNLSSIGIELSAEPGRDASDMTYQTAAQLISALAGQLGLPLVRSLLHPHQEFTATSCPGTVNLDKLFSLAVRAANPLPDQEVGPAVSGVLTAAVAAHPYNFQYNLSPGMVGEEVGKLQDALIELGCVADVAGVQAGKGVYGPRTQQAVTQFQLEHHIISSGTDYGAGYFGPKTRATINNL